MNYIVKHNGVMIDASVHPQVSVSDLQDSINFTSPREESYLLLSTALYGKFDGFRKSSEQFTVDFTGLIPTYTTTKLSAVLKETWQTHLTNTKVSIQQIRQEEFIGKNGETVTKVFYFASGDNNVLYPTLTASPDTSQIVSVAMRHGINVQTYTSSELTSVTSCYKLFLYSNQAALDTVNVTEPLIETWNQTQQFMTASLRVLKTEQYVGSYGSQLTGYLYQIVADGISLEPDYIVEPDSMIVRGTSLQTLVYNDKQHYRLTDLHQVKLSGVLSKSKISKLEATLIKAWNTTVHDQQGQYVNVSAKIVGVQETVDKATSEVIPQVFYQLDVADVPVSSWEIQSLPDDDVEAAITEDFGTEFEMWTNLTNILREVYLSGSAKTNYKDNKGSVRSALVSAYATANNVNNEDSVDVQFVQEDSLSSETYVIGSNWNAVTMFKYSVSISTKPSSDIVAPSSDVLSGALTPHNLNVEFGQVNKVRKIYLVGARTSLDTEEISVSISKSWGQTNTELSTASVYNVMVKGATVRTKRDTSHSSSFTLVGKNGEEITPTQFTVSVNGEEPNEIFVSPPDDDTLNHNLADSHTSTCGCTPRADGHVTLEGKTPNTEFTKIQQAVQEAVANQNSGVDSSSISVDIINVEDSNDNGQDISTVKYWVTCTSSKTCDVETLAAPSKAVLEQSLGQIGKTLFSKAEPVEDEKNEWLIPVAVACGIVLFIIIISVICCIIYRRRKQQKWTVDSPTSVSPSSTRHRKKGDFKQQEVDVNERNGFDREHFSDPAVFENRAYAADSGYMSKEKL